MIEIKDFLLEKGFPIERIEQILSSFFDDNSLINTYQKIIGSDIQIDRLAAVLQDYSDLCKENLLSHFLTDRDYALKNIEMVELLGAIILGLNLILEGNKNTLFPSGFSK